MTPSAASTSAATSPTSQPDTDWDVGRALRKLGATAAGRKQLYREGLRLIVKHFESPYGTLSIDTSSGTFEDRVDSGTDACQQWKSACSGLLLDSRYRNLPVAKLYASDSLAMTFAALAAPVAERGDSVIGSLAIVAPTRGKAAAAGQLAEFKALVSLLGSLVDSIEAVKRPDRTTAGAGPASVGSHGSLHEFCFSLANGLKAKVGCEQVCIGLVRGASVRVACISGLDDLYPRSPGARLIRQAMEECLDADEPIFFQHETAADRSVAEGYLLHRRWHNGTSNSAVASVPLHVAGKCAAVLSLRKSGSGKFSKAELKKIHDAVSPLMSGLGLLEQASRGLAQHAWETAGGLAGRWLGRGAWARKVVAAAILAAAAWALIGETEMVVTVPCQIVAAEVREVAAPFEGRLTAAHVRPGDAVQAGQLLLEFDVSELLLEKQKGEAERSIAELEMSRAVSAGEHMLAAKAAARLDAAHASLELVQYRLDHSRIEAPVSGTILSGEFEMRIGEVIRSGEPLLDFAPTSPQRLELHVPQYAATHLARGQSGRFTTTARPDLTFRCELDRIPASSSIVENRSVFVAESTIADQPEWFRGGMTGVAKIEAGRRPVWWVGIHRIVNAFRLYLWKI